MCGLITCAFLRPLHSDNYEAYIWESLDMKYRQVKFVHRLYCFCTFPSLHAVAPKRFWVINKEINGAKKGKEKKSIRYVIHSWKQPFPAWGCDCCSRVCRSNTHNPQLLSIRSRLKRYMKDIVPLKDKILPSIKVPVPIPKHEAHTRR